MISSLLGAKLGAALAGGALVFGGATAAAYAGALPDAAQSVAAVALGAPLPETEDGGSEDGTDEELVDGGTDDSTDGTENDGTGEESQEDGEEGADGESDEESEDAEAARPVGPDATGPAAYGLCRAWSNHAAKGKDMTHAIAFRNLAEAAGGAEGVEDYCAALPEKTDDDATEDEESPEGTTEDSATAPRTKPSKEKPAKATTAKVKSAKAKPAKSKGGSHKR